MRFQRVEFFIIIINNFKHGLQTGGVLICRFVHSEGYAVPQTLIDFFSDKFWMNKEKFTRAGLEPAIFFSLRVINIWSPNVSDELNN